MDSVLLQNMPFIMQGYFMTLKVAFVSMVLSLGLGMVLGVLRFARVSCLSRIVGAFVDVTRSIPLILYIIFVHFSFSPFLYERAAFVKYFGINCLEMFSAILALAIFTSAYIAEIVRSGLEGVEKQQILAAKSLALSRSQVIEYVVLPQALNNIKPALCAQFVTLLKDTSLASAIGLVELTRASEIVYESAFHEFQILLFVACLYILTNFLIQLFFRPHNKNLYT